MVEPVVDNRRLGMKPPTMKMGLAMLRKLGNIEASEVDFEMEPEGGLHENGLSYYI